MGKIIFFSEYFLTCVHYLTVTSLSCVHHQAYSHLSQVYTTSLSSVYHCHLMDKYTSPHCQVYTTSLSSVYHCHLMDKYTSPDCQVYITSLSSVHHMTLKCTLSPPPPPPPQSPSSEGKVAQLLQNKYYIHICGDAMVESTLKKDFVILQLNWWLFSSTKHCG